MLVPINLLRIPIRHYKHNTKPKFWESDGVKYGLVTYYPRYPGEKDPPITPTKLFLIERVKKVKGNPYWHKQVLRSLGIDNRHQRDQTIVKNTPENCAMLWSIKHLIKVTPIHLPDKLPTENDDVSTYLHDNGKLLVFPKIDEKRLEATMKHQQNPKTLDNLTLSKLLRLRWMNPIESQTNY